MTIFSVSDIPLRWGPWRAVFMRISLPHHFARDIFFHNIKKYKLFMLFNYSIISKSTAPGLIGRKIFGEGSGTVHSVLNIHTYGFFYFCWNNDCSTLCTAMHIWKLPGSYPVFDIIMVI